MLYICAKNQASRIMATTGENYIRYANNEPKHMGRKRLLFVISRFLDGGIDTVLLEYLRHIVKQQEYVVTLAIGVRMNELEVFLSSLPREVKVFYFNKSKWLTRYPIRKVKGTLSRPMKIMDEALVNPFRRRSVGIGLRRMAAFHDVVIDFACSYPSFLVGVEKPKVGFYHFSLPSDIATNTHVRKRMLRRMSKYDRIVTISRAMETQFVENFPELADRVRMIYNAKDVELIREKAEDASVTTPEKGTYLLAIERLEESQKDISTLLQAMKLLKAKYGLTTPLYILGKGKSEQQLKQLAQELGVEDVVKFMGFTPNPYPWLKNCAILLHSAKFEGLPTVLIEGLLLDKLIISSDCPTGPKEILDNGKAGVLVPTGDAEGFAAAVKKLLTDEEARDSILKGIEVHRHVFTFEETHQQFKEIINHLVMIKK